MYEVLIERSAERDLKSLPTPLFHRIVSPQPTANSFQIRKHLERSAAVERLELLEPLLDDLTGAQVLTAGQQEDHGKGDQVHSSVKRARQ